MSNQQETFIQLNNISKIFRTASGDFTALDNISSTFSKGEFVSVVGKSGSGKSTLMNMITGIDKPSSGEIIIENIHTQNLSETEMAKWRGKNLGIVFQFYQLLPVMSLLENVLLPMQIANLYTPEEREKRAKELLAQVGLEAKANKRPATVSGGQQQSAAIARALANNPPILIADEPTGNLDSASAANIIHIFEELSHQGKTIIMVTHDQDLAKRASRTLVLSDGVLIKDSQNNSKDNLKKKPLSALRNLWKTNSN